MGKLHSIVLFIGRNDTLCTIGEITTAINGFESAPDRSSATKSIKVKIVQRFSGCSQTTIIGCGDNTIREQTWIKVIAIHRDINGCGTNWLDGVILAILRPTHQGEQEQWQDKSHAKENLHEFELHWLNKSIFHRITRFFCKLLFFKRVESVGLEYI
jgi:hypothetical protein